MAENAPFLPGLSPVGGKPIHVSFDGGRLTSDAGVLVLAEIERRLGLAERLARCVADPRSPERIHHTLAEMIRFRVLLIAAGYSDANDCDGLRVDPAFKLAVGRLPASGGDLCSQPTMCRLENLPGAVALKRMMAAMVELFCDSYEQVPRRIMLDIEPGSPRTLFVGWGRHLRSGARWPAAVAVSRPPRRALLLTHPRLRGWERQAGGGDPASRQDPGRDRGDARPAPRRGRHPPTLATCRHPGPRRQPLCAPRGDELVRAQPHRLCLRAGRQQDPAQARGGPDGRGRRQAGRGRRHEGPPPRRVPLRRQDLARRAPGDRADRSLRAGRGQPVHRHQPARHAALAVRGGLLRPRYGGYLPSIMRLKSQFGDGGE